MKYRKKPVIIEAVLFDTLASIEAAEAFASFLLKPMQEGIIEFEMADEKSTGTLIIKTLEGNMIASPGDWIIKGVQGEFYPCKPDIFEATYEKVEE